mmetsp:Transcript_9942/g.11165  ORF Transcript_9942/g.11165 Transcript_9942/m.11165 type:complete len:166 (-) Transcript_9942:92-589(-)
MICDTDQIFWKKRDDKSFQENELEEMFQRYEYEVPEDIDLHFESITKHMENFDYLVAVISKGFEKKSLLKRVFRSIKYAIRFRNNKQGSQSQAKFFMTVFKEDIIMKMLRLSENNLLKSQSKKGLPKTMLDKKIYIPITKDDEITLGNLDDTSLPKMLAEDLDLP